ncbi:MAG: cation:proton antiporter [Verrucomicrobia bacterium]|nr:cation:proton antiporter [Verrucomicrobiota bacterium]
MTRLILQLAVILVASRLGGGLFDRLFKWPRVLGELAAGMLIGPFALGAVPLPGLGPLFSAESGPIPLSPELYGLATLASIVLLFLSGLETDLATLLRYSFVSSIVGIGGIVFSFSLGAMSAVWFGVADGFMDPRALFLGAISTATSVGITARLLSEKRKMGTPEGVTILGGAVIDDVLGIVVLAVVVGMAKAMRGGEQLDWGPIAAIAAKAIGFWAGCIFLGLTLAKRITRVMKMFGSAESIAVLSLGIALLMAGLSEMAGLAMIIGAYIAGLSLSRTDLVNELQERIAGLYSFLVPVFFCVMGMLVDFSSMRGVVVFGLVYSLIAILAKVLGCGLPAWLMDFNLKGALRIGAGMLPRGEVALIIAGVGLSTGVIGPDIFGVSIMMTILTTIIAPVILLKSFDDTSGVKANRKQVGQEVECIKLDFPTMDIAEFLMTRIRKAFRNEEFFVHRLHADLGTYQIRKDDMVFTLIQDDRSIVMNADKHYQHIARLILLEEILSLQDLLDSVKQMKSPDSMGSELLAGLFGGD